ncbi:uncharacterized protein BO80DRAFT_446550 [Aspergillus ibericus CBS 121593]|uniref:Uncharacterized protein n=1 Tax=Aspergillus ibericus CBS 121593 TaxID=1448316 RepID=A0A395GUL3_9EURO|nr:hypothetical protein BO80DRAFT_446550 [Aspergillus ibericus CBS 121593]RAK99261.1 hypothetical protein BO80DRAFT_446550 [Aspergillus ibericus CBS 121593]
MPSSQRFFYSISATVIFLLTLLGIVLTSDRSIPSLTQQFQQHVCPTSPSEPSPPITRKFHSLTPLLGVHPDTSQSPSADISWESLLLPQNGGMLRVQTSNDTVTDYGISMFHQLHCLTVLRGLIFPGTSQHHGASTSPSHSGDAHEDAVHWAHCFDYIAQAIICAADDTIEPPHSVIDKDGKSVLVIDGIGHTHQCRDPEPLWRAVLDSGTHAVSVSDVKATVGDSGVLQTGRSECENGCLMPPPYRVQ